MLSRLAMGVLPLLLFACVPEEAVSTPNTPPIDAARNSTPGAASENRAPEFDKISVSGEQISPETYSGNPVIVSFWATTCVPCRRELPMLEQLASEHSASNLSVLTINTGEPHDLINEFFEDISVDLPVIVDTDGILATEFELLFLPMTYFIDGDWNLLYRTIGEPNEKQLEHGLNLILPTSS